MGLKLTLMPVSYRDLLGLLDLSGPIIDASRPTATVHVCFPPPAQPPTHLSPCYSGLKLVHTREKTFKCLNPVSSQLEDYPCS